MNARLAKIENWERLAQQAQFQPAAMAALCPVSLRHLQRFFTSRFSQTPGQWSRKLRCRLARRLISEGWSNKAVATELGFSNESHLCREFKRYYGAPPQSFGPVFVSREHPSLSDLVRF